MSPKSINDLDPKLKEAYNRVMGTDAPIINASDNAQIKNQPVTEAPTQTPIVSPNSRNQNNPIDPPPPPPISFDLIQEKPLETNTSNQQPIQEDATLPPEPVIAVVKPQIQSVSYSNFQMPQTPDKTINIDPKTEQPAVQPSSFNMDKTHALKDEISAPSFFNPQAQLPAIPLGNEPKASIFSQKGDTPLEADSPTAKSKMNLIPVLLAVGGIILIGGYLLIWAFVFGAFRPR